MFRQLALLVTALVLTSSNVVAVTINEPVVKPIIGISIDNGDDPVVEASKLGMIEQVQLAGGIPLIFNDRGDRSPEKDLKHIDALIVQGDALDVDPAQYGQAKHPKTEIETDKTRTNYEDKIIASALKNKVPVLLICGGMQRANVLMGGTLHQNITDLSGVSDVHGNNNGNPPEVPSLPVKVVGDSTLAKILGTNSAMVNSFHHQALDKIGKGFRVVAYSDAYIRPDGTSGHLVEAIEGDPKGDFAQQFILGLQFHPEMMPDNPLSVKIFASFTKAAREYALVNGLRHEDEKALRKISHNWQVSVGTSSIKRVRGKE